MSLSWMYGFFRFLLLLLAEVSSRSHNLRSLQPPIRLERAKYPLTNQRLHQAADAS